MAKPKIVPDPEAPVAAEVLESAVVDVAAGVRKLMSSRFTKRAIILLIQDAAGAAAVTKSQVEAVIDAVADLDKRCLKPTGAKK